MASVTAAQPRVQFLLCSGHLSTSHRAGLQDTPKFGTQMVPNSRSQLDFPAAAAEQRRWPCWWPRPREHWPPPCPGLVPWLLAHEFPLESMQGKEPGTDSSQEPQQTPRGDNSQAEFPSGTGAEPSEEALGRAQRMRLSLTSGDNPSTAAAPPQSSLRQQQGQAADFGGVWSLCRVPGPPGAPHGATGLAAAPLGLVRAPLPPAQSPYLFPRRGGKKGGFVFSSSALCRLRGVYLTLQHSL